jgi:hypothetical protein
LGDIYTVTLIDDDGTFRAADGNGAVGNWLRWEECEPAAPSLWDRLAAELPPEIVSFLSCFDGIRSLSLKQDVVDAILRKVPDLHERITHIAGTADGACVVAGNQARPIDNSEIEVPF